MRNPLSWLLLSTVLPTSIFAWDNWCLNHHWTVWGEGLYMRRTELNGHSIVTNSQLPQCQPCTPAMQACNQCPSFTVLNTKKLVKDFHYESGYRVGMVYHPNWRSSFDAIYMNMGEWGSKAKIHGPAGSLSFPFNDSHFAHDFRNADQVEAIYHSRIWGAESNYWWHYDHCPGSYFAFSWLAGIRYFNLREFFDVEFRRHGLESNYTIRTVNQIGGVQVGLDLQFNPYSFLSWDFTPKGGVFYTHAKLKTFLGDHNNTVVLRNFEDTGGQATLMFEVPISLTYRFKRHFNIHGGYEMLYLTGVALAPEQIHKKSVTSSNVNIEGQILIHGAFLGLGIGY